MTDCGCAGTWKIDYTYDGGPNSYSFDGYANDAPTLKPDPEDGCARPLSIFSTCDGRKMRGLSCNANIFSHSFKFTPGPDCGTKPEDPYDCLNGKCVKASDYKTPGIFKKLDDCKSACGGGARCDGVCLDKDEVNKIKALAGDIKGKVCP